MKTLHIVRHGQTDFNLRGIVQGSGVDAPLNETGYEQARQFHAAYADHPYEVVLTSALQRTWQSVQRFIDAGISWEKHPNINEMSWGSHEGKSGTPESIAEYQAIKNGWGEGRIDGRIGGGESAREMGERLQAFIDHLRTREEKQLLIASHGRAMCGLVTLLMGRPIDRMNELRHSNLGLWVGTERADGHYDFSVQNDRAHMSEELKAGTW